MLTRSKFCLLLFVLHCPPSLLIPQQDVSTTSNTNNLVVLEPNPIEHINQNNSQVTELLQQIDVKDDENHVISNIKHVVITDESMQNDNNGTNNIVVHNILEQTGNISSVLNTTGVTNPSSLLLSNSLNGTSGNPLKADNMTVKGLKNELADETQTNPLNTSNNANVKNGPIKEVGAVQNGSTVKVNVGSTIVPYISGGTTINFIEETEVPTSENTILKDRSRRHLNKSNTNNTDIKSVTLKPETDKSNNIIDVKFRTKVNVSSTIVPYISGGTTINFIEETEVPTLQTINVENNLHESLKNTEIELAWRSDIPVRKNKTKNSKHIAKLDSQNATLLAKNINGNINNNKSGLVDSENDDEKSVFVILNSGHIDGLSVNSPANSGRLQTNLENKNIENLNFNSSKLLNDLINSTINDVFSKILKQTTQRIFLLLNSGSISNVHVSSPILENIAKNTILKDRSRRHLNESNINNTNRKSVTLKPETDKSNNIIDVKFRTDEHQGTKNYVSKENHVSTVPLDNKENNTTLRSNAPDNATLANSIEIPIEDISSAEAPAFRSLILDKISKLQQVSNVVNSELNETRNHNLVLKLSPESSPISIDLNQIPVNNILGGALSFIKRLKRSTHVKAENIYPWKTNCKSKQIVEHHTVTSCKKPKLNDNDLTIPTKKSFDDVMSSVLKLDDSVELVCPLSVIVKLYIHQVLDNISKNDPDSVFNKILGSFVKGNEDAINLASMELSNLPVPVKLRLQLVHGKSKKFMEQLSAVVDSTLCSLS